MAHVAIRCSWCGNVVLMRKCVVPGAVMCCV